MSEKDPDSQCEVKIQNSETRGLGSDSVGKAFAFYAPVTPALGWQRQEVSRSVLSRNSLDIKDIRRAA